MDSAVQFADFTASDMAIVGPAPSPSILCCYEWWVVRGKLGIYRELGLVYKELGQYETAYRLLRDSMNAFDPTTSYRDLYDFGQAAFEAGRTREAALIFRLGEKKVPPDNKEW